jgi:hypothetical protein
MTDNGKATAISKGKKAVFTIAAILSVIAIASFAVSILDRIKIIDTSRLDDLPVMDERPILEKSFAQDEKRFRVANSVEQQEFAWKIPDGTSRIFLTGGSFALGEPYIKSGWMPDSPGFGGIHNWLGAILEVRYSSTRFEVINASQRGVGSKRVAQIVRELIPAGPSLILVATGNNEYFSFSPELNRALHKWALYRLMKKGLLPKPSDRSLFPEPSAEPEQIRGMFHKNIEAIVDECEQAGVRLALITLPINVKYLDPEGDFGSESVPENADCAEAAERFMEGGSQPEAAYRVAECYEAKGDADKALDFYKLYTELAPLGRMRPSYNEFIRETAAKRKVMLVDLERYFEQRSPDGIPESGLFVDNCHLNWRGYFLVAVETERVIEKNGIFGAPSERPVPEANQIIEEKGWQAVKAFDTTQWLERTLKLQKQGGREGQPRD